MSSRHDVTLEVRIDTKDIPDYEGSPGKLDIDGKIDSRLLVEDFGHIIMDHIGLKDVIDYFTLEGVLVHIIADEGIEVIMSKIDRIDLLNYLKDS